MRIAFLAGEITCTGKLFGSLPAELLARAGHDVVCDLSGPPDLAVVDGRDGPVPRDRRYRDRDLHVLIRPADPRLRGYVDAARRGGARVVHLVDDWLFGEGYRVGAYGGGDGVRAVLATYRDCDGFVVSTPRLAANLAVYAKPTWLMRNCLWDRYWEGVVPRPPDGTVRIGWTGMARIRRHDLAPLGPVLRGVLADHPAARFVAATDPVALEVLGLAGHPQACVDGWVPFEEFPPVVARLDIGLAPVADSEVNACKSAIKVLEYWAGGAAAVAQRGHPEYSHWVRDGENGFLAGAPEEWDAVLRRLLADPGLLARSRAAGRDAAAEHFASRVGPGYVSLFEDIATRVCPEVQVS